MSDLLQQMVRTVVTDEAATCFSLRGQRLLVLVVSSKLREIERLVQKAEEFCAESGANNAKIEAKNDLWKLLVH